MDISALMFEEMARKKQAIVKTKDTLRPGPVSSFMVPSRRGFLAGATALSFGVVLAGCAKDEQEAAAEAEAPEVNTTKESTGSSVVPNLWVSFVDNGKINITCHRSEMGQQVLTSMAQIIADELEAPWDDVEVIQAEGHPRYGNQNTDGSSSVKLNFDRLRLVGAAMRLMLEQAAADQWGVARDAVTANQGVVREKNGSRSAPYAELATATSALPVPSDDQITLKPSKDWRYIGQSQPSRTIPEIVNGEGTFGMDVQLPDMLYAVIAHPPQILGKVKSYDDSAALQVPGVVRTMKMPDATDPVVWNPLGGVAVVATDTWAAIQGRYALDVDWEAGPNGDYNSVAYKQKMMETARTKGDQRRNRGDVYAALKAADKTISADYYIPHLSQAPMEPPVATARWTDDGKVECWAPSQTPQRAREVVAAVCGVDIENVTVHVTWLGGGFGRKSNPDFVAEAALIAREAGRPVKLVWTREDDLGWGFTHTVSAQHLEAGFDADGNNTAFLHRVVAPPISSSFSSGDDEPAWFELMQGATDNPFTTPNLRVESGRAKAHVRTGWLRSVANIYQVFAIQSFVAEMAHAAGRDPKDYLLELIGEPRTIDPAAEGAEYPNYGNSLEDYPIDTGRLSHVARKAAEMANWGRTLPDRHGLGIAVHRSFQSYVGTVIEVAVADDGALSIEGVWSAIDAGIVVNKGNVESQLQGGTIYGLSNALYGQLTMDKGAVEQVNFPDYRVLRMAEAPRSFETHIVPSDSKPGGVGEPPTPPAAPALANAIFAATGMRLRTLPMIGPDRDTLPLAQSENG